MEKIEFAENTVRIFLDRCIANKEEQIDKIFRRNYQLSLKVQSAKQEISKCVEKIANFIDNNISNKEQYLMELRQNLKYVSIDIFFFEN